MKQTASCLIASAAALAVAGCSTYGDDYPAAPPPYTATADLRDAYGRSTGTASAEQVGDDIRVRIQATNLPPGAHGAHIHMTGVCTPPGYESAGGHWNPTGREHGKDNPEGMHLGDLANLLIGADGVGSMEFTIPNARVSGGAMAMLDQDGAAMVIHANPDDHRTDPSGNSGARVACGAFR